MVVKILQKAPITVLNVHEEQGGNPESRGKCEQIKHNKDRIMII